MGYYCRWTAAKSEPPQQTPVTQKHDTSIRQGKKKCSNTSQQTDDDQYLKTETVNIYCHENVDRDKFDIPT